MTRAEFLRGWILLTTQPWGKAYRAGPVEMEGEPSPAEIQLQFYYTSLEKYEAEAWLKTCEIHATGDHWPNLDALKLTLKHQAPKRLALPPPPEHRPHDEPKEDFGIGTDLFNAIKCQAGMRQAERTAAIFKQKGLPQREKEYLERAKNLQQQLSETLKKNTIAPVDLQRLLAIS
jgi:hypothetical protein